MNHKNTRTTMHEQSEKFDQAVGKKIKNSEILELKNTTIELISSMEVFKSRLYHAAEKISATWRIEH